MQLEPSRASLGGAVAPGAPAAAVALGGSGCCPAVGGGLEEAVCAGWPRSHGWLPVSTLQERRQRAAAGSDRPGWEVGRPGHMPHVGVEGLWPGAALCVAVVVATLQLWVLLPCVRQQLITTGSWGMPRVAASLEALREALRTAVAAAHTPQSRAVMLMMVLMALMSIRALQRGLQH